MHISNAIQHRFTPEKWSGFGIIVESNITPNELAQALSTRSLHPGNSFLANMDNHVRW